MVSAWRCLAHVRTNVAQSWAARLRLVFILGFFALGMYLVVQSLDSSLAGLGERHVVTRVEEVSRVQWPAFAFFGSCIDGKVIPLSAFYRFYRGNNSQPFTRVEIADMCNTLYRRYVIGPINSELTEYADGLSTSPNVEQQGRNVHGFQLYLSTNHTLVASMGPGTVQSVAVGYPSAPTLEALVVSSREAQLVTFGSDSMFNLVPEVLHTAAFSGKSAELALQFARPLLHEYRFDLSFQVYLTAGQVRHISESQRTYINVLEALGGALALLASVLAMAARVFCLSRLWAPSASYKKQGGDDGELDTYQYGSI